MKLTAQSAVLGRWGQLEKSRLAPIAISYLWAILESFSLLNNEKPDTTYNRQPTQGLTLQALANTGWDENNCDPRGNRCFTRTLRHSAWIWSD